MLTLAIHGVKNDGKKSLVAVWPCLLFLKHPMHGLGLSHILSFELGHCWFYKWDPLCSSMDLIHVGQRPLIWEVSCWMTSPTLT